MRTRTNKETTMKTEGKRTHRICDTIECLYALLAEKAPNFSNLNAVQVSFVRAGMSLLSGKDIASVRLNPLNTNLTPNEIGALQHFWNIVDRKSSRKNSESVAQMLSSINALFAPFFNESFELNESFEPGVLTGREEEVISLIVDGLSNKEIALALNIAVRTAETHRQHIMQKLDIHSTAGLTRFAIAAGITPLHLPPPENLIAQP